MPVTADLFSPPSGIVLPLTILRPATTVEVHSGVGNYDIDFEWDTVTSFDSGNLITVSQNNVVAGEYSSVPTSDLDSGSTWFTRVVVDDLGDGSDTSATHTLTWFDPVDSDRFLYTAVMTQVGFEDDPPTEGWRVITGSEPGDGDQLDFDRFLYTAVMTQVGFEDDPPTEGWRQITGSEPGDGDQLDFDRFLYAAVNVTADVFLSGGGNAASEGTAALDVDAAFALLAGAGDAASDAAGSLNLNPAALSGGGNAAADGSAAFTVVVLIAGAGGAASDGSAAMDVSALSGSGDAASEGSGALTLEAALAGSGNAASDGSGAFTVEIPLAGAGDASSEGSGILGTSVSLSGSGNAASDGSGDMGDFSFMLGSGDAASEGSGALTVTISIALSVTLPVMQFTALLDYILNPGLVGGVIRPSSAAYAPFSAVGGTATGSPGGQQGDYFPVLADPSLYQPLIMWRKHSLVAGDDPPRAVLVPYTVIPEE